LTMAYYPDLSIHPTGRNVFKVGWLDRRHPFEKAKPLKWMIEKLWRCCDYSLLQAYGFHECNLLGCSGRGKKFYFRPKTVSISDLKKRYDSFNESGRLISNACKAQLLGELEDAIKNRRRGYSRMILGIHPRSGQKIELGYAQIIVFGRRDKIYVAPNMIYHYVTVHHYKPPDEFIQALRDGPCPPEPEYVERLKTSGLPIFYVEVLQTMWEAKEKKRAVARKRKAV
jgi:hypothetical protein